MFRFKLKLTEAEKVEKKVNILLNTLESDSEVSLNEWQKIEAVSQMVEKFKIITENRVNSMLNEAQQTQEKADSIFKKLNQCL